jgi:ferrous iron transport protein B
VLRRLRLLMAIPGTLPAVTVLVGAESAGKSTLASALSGAPARADNVAGSTVGLERFTSDGHTYLDTPGLVHRVDSDATRATLAALHADGARQILLVLRATHLDEELAELLPLVAGERGAVAVTHWDRVEDGPAARDALHAVAAATGVPFVPVDARDAEDARRELRTALRHPGTFTRGPVLARVGWRIEPPPTPLEHRWLGPPLGLVLLLAPAVASVWAAVTLAAVVEPGVERALEPLVRAAGRLPRPLGDVVAGEYGALTMGPLLLVWALPVVFALALLLAIGKASGLVDRLTTVVHPLVRPFRLTGRDLVRVVAGYGCNVPAVIATRSCSSCSRDTTIAAIAFGSVCSYQLAATLGVLAAARRPGLVVPYVAVLALGALVHARLSARGAGARPGQLDLGLLHGRAFLTRPRWSAVRREAATTLHHVTLRALPVFLAIIVVASLLAATGAMDAAARPLEPLLALLRLPGDVALPVLLASVRKDGLLLLAEPGLVDQLDDAQLLAALVLAGALLPCLVTAVTIARERSRQVAARLLACQAAGALALTAVISWAGLLVVQP